MASFVGERSAPGVLSKVVIILVLLASVGAQESLTTKMQVIHDGLNRKLNEIMALDPVIYSTINTTAVPYNASTKFYPKGMGQLYNVTNMFMDLIQSKEAYPEGIITIENGSPVFADPIKEWKIIATHYAGVLGLAISGLLLAAILPCVGLFFCCCRCAGNCGARSQPFDKKHDHCRKILLTIVLISVSTILLFGVVCAFVTNEYMQEGTDDLSGSLKTNLKDVELYLKVTKLEISNLLGNNYNELEERSNRILQESGKIVMSQLAESSHAVSLTNLNNIVAGLDKVQQNLETLDDKTRELRIKADALDQALRVLKSKMSDPEFCAANEYCQQVRNNYVNTVTMKVDYDKLPNVTSALQKIRSLMDNGIVQEVSEGNQSFARIQKDIQIAVNSTIPTVRRSIRQAGEFLQSTANNITRILDYLATEIDKKYIPYVELAGTRINEYSPYRYYLGLGISGILLIVLLCLTFGLLCGVCGKRPDGYGDDCCNKGAGARFLMMAVWIIFLLTSILMIVTVAHMVTGVIAQRGICEPLKNPRDNRMFELVDEFVQIKKKLYPNNPEADLDMSYIVTSCHANETLYKVLKLQNLINLESLRNYVQQYNINKDIQHLRQKISLSPGVVILSDKARQKLDELAKSGLSDIKFHQYAEELRYNITSINLEYLANKLREVANRLQDDAEDIKIRLENAADELEEQHKKYAFPIMTLSEELIDTALTLQEHIKFNHSSMTEAIARFVAEVTVAQQFLNESGSHHVEKLATKFEAEFLRQFDDFMDYVTESGLNTIGKCAPVSNAYNATLVAACNKILDPFNGFWASVGWCLILFIPTIILCVKLSALYQKSDPYPGPLVEAEYLYDAYADRDNIPLAHVHDKKHGGHSRHHPVAVAESYDGPAGAYAERERISDGHQSSSHHDSRYTDLAPKNWDFPNGGPPRYQPATAAPPLSTEYERPPPYYYPGPGDRN